MEKYIFAHLLCVNRAKSNGVCVLYALSSKREWNKNISIIIMGDGTVRISTTHFIELITNHCRNDDIDMPDWFSIDDTTTHMQSFTFCAICINH